MIEQLNERPLLVMVSNEFSQSQQKQIPMRGEIVKLWNFRGNYTFNILSIFLVCTFCCSHISINNSRVGLIRSIRFDFPERLP